MDLEAERSVIGAILVDEGHYWSVAEILRPDQFYLKKHRIIYSTIKEVIQEGKSLNWSILISRIGPELEGESTQHTLGSLHRRAEDQDLRAVDFIEKIVETWTRRRLMEIAAKASAAATNMKKHATDHLLEIQADLADTAMGAEPEPLKSIGDASTRALKKSKDARDSGLIPGYDTGLPTLDELIGRIMPTDLGAILMAQGDGKTVTAMQVAARIADAYGGALVFSLEMRDEDLARRSLASESEITTSEIEEGTFSAFDYERLMKSHQHLLNRRLWIDDRPNLYLDQMRDRVIRAKKSKGIKAAFYDHARKIRVRGHKFSDKFERMEYITGFLKELAKETEVAQVLLCQRSRSSQRRDDPAPRISDFPEGPSLEQDCDWILGGLRRDIWLNQNKPTDWESREGRQWQEQYEKAKGKIEAYMLKHRRRQAGEMRELLFNGRYQRLEEL